MRIAYLILTHGMPDHLGRMIAALRDDETRLVPADDGTLTRLIDEAIRSRGTGM